MAPDTKHPPPKQSHRRGKKGPEFFPHVPKRARKRIRPPTVAEFLREAEALRDRALAVLKRDGHHVNICIGWCPDGHTELIGFDVPEGGPSMGTVLAAIVKTRRLRCFIAVSEAWMTRGPAADLTVMPSESPDREEALVVSAVHPEVKRMWAVPFAREHGQITLGKTLDSAAEGMTLGGGIPEALEGGRP